ncbi:MAG: Unknown protein, partial [uncultured Sulfurovum sp.]
RSTEVIESTFDQSEKLCVCVAFSGDSFLSNKSQFTKLHQLGVKFPKERYIYKEWDDDDECYLNYMFFTIEKSELRKFLFGKMANELGIQPSYWFDLYIYDPELEVLAHPYDDRGMDLAGSNKVVLSRIYKQFNNWLLNYDLSSMNKWFDNF